MRRAMFFAALALVPATSASAFCGFYVKQDETHLTSRASRVVLMRDGTTTVLSMQSTYEGPPDDFALIVPVPSPIRREDVQTLEPDVLDRIDQLTSPRLVEYWEQAPVCVSSRGYGMGLMGAVGYGAGGGRVVVEARFAVGEYDVVVLGADDSSALETWLRNEGYRVPPGASEVLRPYVQSGHRFFAARVNAQRVRFENGRALLSPLRIRYQSDTLALPVRLGMLSSPGTQDLIVYVVSRDGRFEVANRENVLVPTNLVVTSAARARFGELYESLLSRLWDRHPGSVVTEYAWSAASCDPCPGPTMSAQDLTTLGGDVASGAQRLDEQQTFEAGPFTQASGPPIPLGELERVLRERREALMACASGEVQTLGVELDVRGGRVIAARAAPSSEVSTCVARALIGRSIEGSTAAERTSVLRAQLALSRSVRWAQTSPRGWTLTRLRYRYSQASPAEDLVFRRATPIVGGTGEPDERGRLDTHVRAASGTSTFQARYAIVHRRSERPTCRHWVHGGWGGLPSGQRSATASSLSQLRTTYSTSLESLIRTPLHEVGLGPAPAPPRRRPRPRTDALPPAVLNDPERVARELRGL